jgi:hypothetical protein
MTDTPRDVEARYRAMLRALPPERRVAMLLSMNATGRQVVLSSLPPGLSPAERRAQFLRRYYGAALPEDAIAAIAAWTPEDPRPPRG